MPKGRPGGNPDIAKYGFEKQLDWNEPCVEKMTLRLPSSMKAAIKAGVVKDWQEVARKAIAAKIEEARSQGKAKPPEKNEQTN